MAALTSNSVFQLF